MADALAEPVYEPDRSLPAKLRRRIVRLRARRPARGAFARPMVSFAFDDAPVSAARRGAEILEARGLRGTYFIAAGLAGTQASVGAIVTGQDVRRLAAAGHEIGCHTFCHLDCGTASAEAVEADLTRSADAFAGWGLPPPTTFAYPYGDVGAAAKRVVGRRFALSRALHRGLIAPGADLNQAPAIGIEDAGGEALAHLWLQRAAARRAWVILFTHGVDDAPSRFGCSAAALEGLADAALAGGFEVVTVAEGAHRASEAA